MRCERCTSDGPVHYCDVDGFAYYLCQTCALEWDAVAESRPSADATAPEQPPAL